MFLRATFKLHTQCPCNMLDARLLYNMTHTLHLSAKKHIIMCFSDKRLLLFTAIVTATIFVYKRTMRFCYCSVVQ